MNRDRDSLLTIRHLLTGPPVDLRAITSELGINIWQSNSLPETIAGKLTRNSNKTGSSGFAIIVRAQDSLVRKRFTIAHEIAHFFLHANALIDGEVVDSRNSGEEFYRSNLGSPRESKANGVAGDILMPWNLLTPLINERPADLARLFRVSREVVDIRLLHPVVRRLKQGVRIDPVLESEFKRLVAKWHADTEHLSSLRKMIIHPAYRRIIQMGPKGLPLLFRELGEHPDHWLVALNAITQTDPAPVGATFGEAVQAWLAWGRAMGYSK